VPRWLKRIFFAFATIFSALFAVVAVVCAATFLGNHEIEDGQKLAGFAEIVKDGRVSVALLDMGDGKLALIDAGNDHEAKAILGAVARRKQKPEDIAAVFLTHGHQDHVAGLYTLMRARIYGLATEAALVGGRRRNRGPFTQLFAPERTGLEISHPLRDGDQVRIGERTVRAFAVPGHTRGSAAYYVDGLLFLGDSANANSAGELTPAKWAFTDDCAENAASLRLLATRIESEKLPVKHLVFAHSGTLEGARALHLFARR